MKQHSQTFKSRFYFPDNFKVDEIITKKNNARDSIFLRFKTKKTISWKYILCTQLVLLETKDFTIWKNREYCVALKQFSVQIPFLGGIG